MRDNHIHINPFPLLNILDFKGHQSINQHGYVSFLGHIKADAVQSCIAVAQQENPIIRVTVIDESGSSLLFFAGVLTEFEITVENQLNLLRAKVMTGTYLMDLNPHIRSFQSPAMTYSTVVNTPNGGYDNISVSINIGGSEQIPGLILQYNETDWTFIKRMASHFNSVLVPSGFSGYPMYDFGIQSRSSGITIESQTYSIRKNIGTYMLNRNNGVNGQTELDVTCYLYKSREIYALGECVTFNHQPLYISEIDTSLEGGELCHIYTLTPKAGLLVPEVYNFDLVGSSLSGKITAVQKAVVQVSIDKDENKTCCGARWFPYATVYSTPDGTGWYCMPEIGDSIRLCVPAEHDEQAYVASSVHLTPTVGAARSNPDYKSIMNKQKKEILFTPSSLLITNNNGMSIELSDQEGIKIISDKAIKIQSDAAVDITSTTSTLSVTAPQRLTFNQGGTSMNMQNRLVMTGAQVHLD